MPRFFRRNGPLARFVANAAETLSLARAVQDVYNTPDYVLRARGTTRDQAMRDLLARN